MSAVRDEAPSRAGLQVIGGKLRARRSRIRDNDRILRQYRLQLGYQALRPNRQFVRRRKLPEARKLAGLCFIDQALHRLSRVRMDVELIAGGIEGRKTQ